MYIGKGAYLLYNKKYIREEKQMPPKMNMQTHERKTTERKNQEEIISLGEGYASIKPGSVKAQAGKRGRRTEQNKYIVHILGENHKKYSAEIICSTSKLFFKNVKESVESDCEIETQGDKNAVILTCTSENNNGILLRRSIHTLVGTPVILCERLAGRSKRTPKGLKRIRGKIISVQPYIVSTPPGEDDLPPIDE